MDISKNNIDQRFAKKLAQHQTTPRAEAWQKLEGRLQKKEDKTVVVRWANMTRWAVAASILLVAGTWYFSVDEKAIQSTNQLSQNNTETTTATTEILAQKSTEVAGRQLDIKYTEAKSTESNLELKYNNLAKNYISKPQEPQQQNIADSGKTEPIQLPKEETNHNTTVPNEILVATAETKMPEVEPLTIVFNVSNFKDAEPILAENDTEKTDKKKSYLNRLFKQLKNAKNGDKVDWQEVGFKPAKILARAENKLKAGEEELKEGYFEVKERTSF